MMLQQNEVPQSLRGKNNRSFVKYLTVGHADEKPGESRRSRNTSLELQSWKKRQEPKK